MTAASYYLHVTEYSLNNYPDQEANKAYFLYSDRCVPDIHITKLVVKSF